MLTDKQLKPEEVNKLAQSHSQEGDRAGSEAREAGSEFRLLTNASEETCKIKFWRKKGQRQERQLGRMAGNSQR